MKEAKFKDVRFNPDIIPFHDMAKEIALAYGFSATLDTNPELAQLIRYRVAIKNQCSYCTILHAQKSRELGISNDKINNLVSYWDSFLYTDIEKDVLTYADVLTEGHHRNFQKFHDKLAENFSEKEIAEIAAIVINMNLWTRLKLAQGETPYFE